MQDTTQFSSVIVISGRDVFEDNMVEDNMVEAKARGLRGQGHKILSSRCTRGRDQSLRTPIPGLFLTRDATHESDYAKSSVFPPLSTPYCRLLCAYVRSIVFMVLSPLLINLINHTQKFNVLRPDLEAKVKAAHSRGQGQGHKNFVLEVSSRSRPVLEDPIPAVTPRCVLLEARLTVHK